MPGSRPGPTRTTDGPSPRRSRARFSERAPWALPLLSRCRGMAPIAWRQGMSVVRQPQQLSVALMIYAMFLFLMCALVFGKTAILFLPTRWPRRAQPRGCQGLWCVRDHATDVYRVGPFVRFPRRHGADRCVGRASPSSRIALTAGQLFVPVAIASAMQWLTMVIIAVALRSVPPSLWAAAAFVPLVSVVLMAIENLPTFWFPMRETRGTKPESYGSSAMSCSTLS